MSAPGTKVNDGTRCGRWAYDAAYDVIEDMEGWGYTIRIRDTQSTDHWVTHMSTKRWVSETDLLNLTTALGQVRDDAH